MGELYILCDGQPVREPDKDIWERWFEQNGAICKIADDEIMEVRVSTSFLGVDYGRGDGPPLVFETLVFGGRSDGDTQRYATRDEALAGHLKIVERLNKRYIS